MGPIPCVKSGQKNGLMLKMRKMNEAIDEMFSVSHNGMSFQSFQASRMHFHMTFKTWAFNGF